MISKRHGNYLFIHEEDVVHHFKVDINSATEPPIPAHVTLILRMHEELEARQAKIDALMLEYCPDDMTEEQVNRWEANQVEGQL